MSVNTARIPRLTRQPVLGLLGLIPVAAAVILLGIVPGKVEALTTTITIITFGLPLLIAATLWWGGWPFRGLSRAGAGWTWLLLLVLLSIILAGIGQAITGAFDFPGLFGVSGAFPIFPYGFVLAAGVFVAMLQFTFVTAKVPFHRLPPVAGGFAALASSWVLGLAQYFLLLHWTGGPGTPPPPAHAGIGPVYALDWPAALLCIVVVQLVFFVLLQGWPFASIRSGLLRFLLVNVFSIGGGVLLLVLLQSVGLNGGQVCALAGSASAAVILMVILFDDWPMKKVPGALGQLGRVGILAVLTAAGAAGYPAGPGVPAVELWVAGVTLNLIAATAIVHVAVFGRWPFPASPPAATPKTDADLSADATT